MIDERHEELAALHAFDLLEGEERAQFVAELDRDPQLRAFVAGLRRSAAAISNLAPEAQPPASLRSRVLASAAARAGSRQPGSPRTSGGSIIQFPAWIPWLAAACIAIGALWSERQYQQALSDNASLREQERLAQSELDRVKAQVADARRVSDQADRQIAELRASLKAEGDLAHFKISTLASMLGNSPAALAVAVWDPSREEGVLSVSKLPALAAEKDYQLWVIDTKYPSPVSGGVFVVDPKTGEARVVFRADKPVHSIAKFAVSLERKGGALKPEGPIVLLSD